MISIIEHIEYLMISNDCVVIPGWGAFIAQYSASHFPMGSSLIEKPSKTISFNASINHNDGLLANSIIKKHAISYAEACNIINSNVAIYKQLLIEGSEIPFGHLGYFASTTDGRMEFVPFFHENNNDAYFGLQSFSFATLAELQQAQEVQPVCNEDENAEETTFAEIQPSRNWFSKKAVKIAASIVVLLGMTGVLTTPIVIDKQNQELATLTVPEVKKQDSPTLLEQQKKQQVITQQEQANKEALQKLEVQQKAEKEQEEIRQKELQEQVLKEKQEQQEIITEQNAVQGKYALIIGATSKRHKAEKYMKYHKDLAGKAHIFKKRKTYYVCYASGDDYSELEKVAQTLPEQYKDWRIMKRS